MQDLMGSSTERWQPGPPRVIVIAAANQTLKQYCEDGKPHNLRHNGRCKIITGLRSPHLLLAFCLIWFWASDSSQGFLPMLGVPLEFRPIVGSHCASYSHEQDDQYDRPPIGCPNLEALFQSGSHERAALLHQKCDTGFRMNVFDLALEMLLRLITRHGRSSYYPLYANSPPLLRLSGHPERGPNTSGGKRSHCGSIPFTTMGSPHVPSPPIVDVKIAHLWEWETQVTPFIFSFHFLLSFLLAHSKPRSLLLSCPFFRYTILTSSRNCWQLFSGFPISTGLSCAALRVRGC